MDIPQAFITGENISVTVTQMFLEKHVLRLTTEKINSKILVTSPRS